MTERSIGAADLIPNLPRVLDEITSRDAVFLVSTGNMPESGSVISGLVSGEGDIVFVLGSPQILGGVFGRLDPEYGWPCPIQITEVRTVSDLMPGHRRHPLLCRGSDCLALSISLSEYRLLQEP